MMGPKTLADVKNELRAAFGKEGKDPIQWLDDRIRTLEKSKRPDKGEIRLLRQLANLLEAENAKSRPARPTATR
jgi:hypothetical protein